MPFCSKCGAEIIEGAKFCQECGAPISAQAEQYLGKRQQEYSGKIYKCPNCGEILNSFEAVCPACGYELRGVKATSSVQEFAKEIAAIEASRPPKEKVKSFREIFLNDQTVIDETDSRIANAIQNFPIPNTKEDIMEFMILTSANINTEAFGVVETTKEEKRKKTIADAWLSKAKQVYVKARNSYGSDPDFQQIEDLYQSCVQDVGKQKKKRALKNFWLFAWIPLAWLLIFVFAFGNTSSTNRDEVERLNNLIEQVQVDLQNEEYKLAMMNALSIKYEGYDKEQERKWPIQRTYWIEKILEEAAAHGVDLEYMIPVETEPPQESEPPEETSPQGFFSGFIHGFQNALNPSPSPSN